MRSLRSANRQPHRSRFVCWKVKATPMRLLPFLLALLAVVAVAGAVSEFRHALTIWHIDRSVAFTVLAATLTVASIRTELYTRSHAQHAQFPARSAVTVVLCFAASLIAIWAGCGTLFETLELCNQEYLHWLPQNQPLSLFQFATGLAIAASATIGIVFLAIGFFLFWFLSSADPRPPLWASSRNDWGSTQIQT